MLQVDDQDKQADPRRLGFLDGVSHELRTPLSSILAFADLSLASPDRLSTQELLAWREVSSSARRLSWTVDNVLDLMLLDGDEANPAIDLVDLVDVIGEVETKVRPYAERKGIKLVVYVSRGVPFIEADPDKLRRALENLADNAIKFSQHGGTVVVHAFYRKNHDEVQIRIDDNGIGIAHADLDRVFDRFVQVDASTSRNYEGCGLGLPVARGFAVLHGGRIEVASTLGEGSSFTVALPAGVSDDVGAGWCHEGHACG